MKSPFRIQVSFKVLLLWGGFRMENIGIAREISK